MTKRLFQHRPAVAAGAQSRRDRIVIVYDPWPGVLRAANLRTFSPRLPKGVIQSGAYTR